MSHVIVVSDTTFFRREYAVDILFINGSIQLNFSLVSFDEEDDEEESSFPRTFQSKSIFALAKEPAASLSDCIIWLYLSYIAICLTLASSISGVTRSESS